MPLRHVARDLRENLTGFYMYKLFSTVFFFGGGGGGGGDFVVLLPWQPRHAGKTLAIISCVYYFMHSIQNDIDCTVRAKSLMQN